MRTLTRKNPIVYFVMTLRSEVSHFPMLLDTKPYVNNKRVKSSGNSHCYSHIVFCPHHCGRLGGSSIPPVPVQPPQAGKRVYLWALCRSFGVLHRIGKHAFAFEKQISGDTKRLNMEHALRKPTLIMHFDHTHIHKISNVSL